MGFRFTKLVQRFNLKRLRFRGLTKLLRFSSELAILKSGETRLNLLKKLNVVFGRIFIIGIGGFEGFD